MQDPRDRGRLPSKLSVWDVTSAGVAQQWGCFFDHGIRVGFTNSVLQLCALDGAPVAAITLSASSVSVHALFQESSLAQTQGWNQGCEGRWR